MTNNSKTGLALLEETLEIYGADRTRWPLEVRRALSGLLSENPDARRLFADGEALDRLLDLAPALEKSRVNALSDRIAAASRTTPRMAATSKAAVPARAVWPPRRERDGAGGVACAGNRRGSKRRDGAGGQRARCGCWD